jgi:hypothetical protein
MINFGLQVSIAGSKRQWQKTDQENKDHFFNISEVECHHAKMAQGFILWLQQFSTGN